MENFIFREKKDYQRRNGIECDIRLAMERN